MRLTTPQKIQELQRKLWQKAKQEPSFRFYSLYDKVYRADVLGHAYALARSRGGAPGVDGRTFERIESEGLERFLSDLQEDLRTGTYCPEAVRRVMIPKSNGGQRPLGIPTIRDRVAQTAAKLVLEPIFEADLPDSAYGYRPGRSALQAVKQVHEFLRLGYTQVVDADLSKYFDTIPHADLLRSVARRVSDKRMLHLLKMWLTVPVEEARRTGRGQRRPSGNRGTPQGGVISPLLANIYMRRFLLAWERSGGRRGLSAHVVNYADDLVILCRNRADEALTLTRELIIRLGLSLNEQKTRLCEVWQEPFDFLGYSFGVQYAFGGGRPYLGAYPSRRGVCRCKAQIRSALGRWSLNRNVEECISHLNFVLRGWTNYFSYGSLWKTYNRVERFVQARVRKWLVRKHKADTRGEALFPASYIYEELGLVQLPALLRRQRTPAAGA